MWIEWCHATSQLPPFWTWKYRKPASEDWGLNQNLVCWAQDTTKCGLILRNKLMSLNQHSVEEKPLSSNINSGMLSCVVLQQILFSVFHDVAWVLFACTQLIETQSNLHFFKYICLNFFLNLDSYSLVILNSFPISDSGNVCNTTGSWQENRKQKGCNRSKQNLYPFRLSYC